MNYMQVEEYMNKNSIYSHKPAPLAGQSEGLITNMASLIEKHSVVVDEHWWLSKGMDGFEKGCDSLNSKFD